MPTSSQSWRRRKKGKREEEGGEEEGQKGYIQSQAEDQPQ
jgi:hypothetical protein